jgi:serine/threonine protein kinase
MATIDALLEIVAYLHTRTPPVIHRDIKPSNIMRRKNGRLVLLDFGSVRATTPMTLEPALTMAGTFGFMAPEQLRGLAEPASDLYAVGMVAAVLLSRRKPGDLVDAEHRLKTKHLHVSVALREWLESMTSLDPAERPPNAEAARRMLARAMAADDAPVAHVEHKEARRKRKDEGRSPNNGASSESTLPGEYNMPKTTQGAAPAGSNAGGSFSTVLGVAGVLTAATDSIDPEARPNPGCTCVGLPAPDHRYGSVGLLGSLGV